ncbi:hypothetical protein DWQ65_02285 [Treponema phagedenis]|nr:hypothetical protein FUT79_08265 [Treponema phagedenis]QEK02180.1 hypothetical protein FUT84_01195 [Treponema phagedenis]QEK05177.1 hypothetical protein FUT83_07440 [Treponema phagedenis]QEK07796.1 hypothetical protein FUT80_00295 [Treponema phagedenis]QEK10798.1 hypothetical protein FUT81_07350 [Treponema phagedenis]
MPSNLLRNIFCYLPKIFTP